MSRNSSLHNQITQIMHKYDSLQSLQNQKKSVLLEQAHVNQQKYDEEEPARQAAWEVQHPQPAAQQNTVPKLTIPSVPTFAAAPKATIRAPTASDIPLRWVSANPFQRLANSFEQLKIRAVGTPQQKAQLNAFSKAEATGKLSNLENQQIASNPVTATALSFANRGLTAGTLEPLINAVSGNDSFSQTAQQAQKLHPVLSKVGELAGYALPAGAAEKGVSVAAKPLLSRLGTSAAAKIARPAITGAVSQSGLAALSDIIRRVPAKETAQDIAQNAAFGGALGAVGNSISNIPLIRSAVKEAGVKGLIIPEEKLGSGLARSAETRAVANANRLMPGSKAAASTAERSPSILSRIPGTPEYVRNVDSAVKARMASPNTLMLPDRGATTRPTLYADAAGNVSDRLQTAATRSPVNSRQVMRENVLQPRAATTSTKLNPDFIGKSAAEIRAASVPKATATTIKAPEVSNELGAMNKSAMQTARETYGSIKEGEQPWGRPVDVPVSVDGKTKVMRFTRTALEATVTDEKTGDAIQSKMMKGGFAYEPVSNKRLVQKAESRVLTGDVNENIRQWLDPEHGNAKPSQRVADGEVLYREAVNRGDTKSAVVIAEQLASDFTEAGRTAQSARILKTLSPESNLFYVQKEVSKMNEKLAERYGEKAPKLAIDEADVNNIINAKTPDEISAARDTALNHIAQNVPATWEDRLNAWRYLSMLGNPKTHIRNILGNALFQPMRKFSDIISAGMEAIPKIGAKVGERQHAVLNPFSKSDKAIMEFAKADYSKMGDVLGGSKFNDLQSAIRDSQPIFTSKNKVLNTALKPLEAAHKGNSAALEAEDKFFSGAAYKDYLAQYMKANHYTPEFMSSGTKEAAEALEKGRNFATLQAKRATFNEANSLASALNRMEKRLDKTTIGKAANVAIEGTLPFKRTPMNIIKRGLEYSPANLLKGLGEAFIPVLKGKTDAATAIEHISEGLTGSGLLGLGAFLGANGIINGPITATGKSKAYGSMNGDQSYSLNILGHTYTIDWLSPAIMPVMMGAELFQNHLPKSMNAVPSFFNSFVNSLSGISDPVFNLTMLQGVNDLFSASGTGNAIGTAISNTFPNFASQLVPTLGGQIARTMQPNRKTTYTGNALLRWTGANKAIAKVPVLANTLPDYRNLWGQTESNGNVANRLFTNFVSPGYVGTRLNTPVDAEVQRLFKGTNSSALPAQAQTDSVSGYRMSPEEEQRFQKIMGQQSYRNLEQLIQDPTYQSLPDYQPGSYNDKLGMVSKIYENAKNAAKIDFYQQRGLPVPDSLTKTPKVTKSKKPNAGKDLYQQISSWK